MFDTTGEDGAGTHPAIEGVAAVARTALVIADSALWSLTDAELAQLVIEHEAAMAVFAAAGLALVRESDRRELGRALGASSGADWARDRLRLKPGEARSRSHLAAAFDVDPAALAAGEQVLTGFDADQAAGLHLNGYPTYGSGRAPDSQSETSHPGQPLHRSPLGLDLSAVEALTRYARTHLPCTAAALRAGRISRDHAVSIAAALSDLPADITDLTAADAEAFLAARATLHDPIAVRRLGRHLVTTLSRRHHEDEVGDPAADDADTPSKAEREAEHARSRTAFSLIDNGDGTHRVHGTFTDEDADIVRTALDPLAAPRPAGDSGPDPRSAQRRYGEALVELCRRATAGSANRRTGVQLLITASIENLLGTPGHAGATSSWGTVITPEALRRMACDAGITRVITDPAGVPLDVGRTKRTVTTGQWNALVARDRGCTFPGCARPPAWTQAHHLRHWADGGPTNLSNLTLLCTPHHQQVHHAGWQVRMAADHHPEFIPPRWVDPDQRARRNIYHRLDEALAQPSAPAEAAGAGAAPAPAREQPESGQPPDQPRVA